MPPKSKSKSTSRTATRQSYRIISMPGTSTAPTNHSNPPPPPPKAANTSKPSARSRKSKGTPRILKNAPPPLPGQSAKYRLEQARFRMWSAHPFVAAFCAFAARCAACRERISGDYRSKTRRFSNTNILRHFGTCAARKAVEAGERAYPAPGEGERPLEVNDAGVRFEVFPGGAPPPGTLLGQKGKRKREETPEEKVEVEEIDLRQPTAQVTSNKRRRVSNAEAGPSRVPPPKVVPPRKTAPPRKNARPRKTAPARKSTPPPKSTPSRTPPPPSTTPPPPSSTPPPPPPPRTTPPPLPRTTPPPLPIVSEVIDSPSPAPHYSMTPTMNPLPPRFRTRSPFVHNVVPSPVQAPADWDSVESEDGFDGHYLYSAPVNIQQRLSEERSTAGPSSANESPAS